MQKRNAIILLILIAPSLAFQSHPGPREFIDAVDALSALDQMGECKCDTDVRAYRYFSAHPDESIPLLIDFTLTRKQRYRVGVMALSKIKDERSINFLIQLADDELHQRVNPVSKLSPYNRNHPYDSESLIKLLIRVFGDYGDGRAVPIIQESLGRLNNPHRDGDREALCKLGNISVDEFGTSHSESVEGVYRIASWNLSTNPAFSIQLYDWIIHCFSQMPNLVAKCHADKVVAFYRMQEYALALNECEAVRRATNNPSLDSERIAFSVDHRSHTLDEMVELLTDKLKADK